MGFGCLLLQKITRFCFTFAAIFCFFQLQLINFNFISAKNGRC